MAAVAVRIGARALIPFSRLLLWAGVVVILYAYRATLGKIMLGFANLIDDLGVSTRVGSIHPFGGVADIVRDVDATIRKLLGQSALALEQAPGALLHDTWVTLKDLGGFNERFSETVAGTFTQLIRHTIPDEGRSADARARAALAPTKATVAHTQAVTLPGIRAHADVLGGKVGHLEDAIEGLRAKVRGHERLLVGAGLTALAIRMLGRLKLGWLRCTKVGKVGRATCAMDLGFLDAVLASALLMFGTYSLVEFAQDMEDVTGEISDGVRWFWRSLEAVEK